MENYRKPYKALLVSSSKVRLLAGLYNPIHDGSNVLSVQHPFPKYWDAPSDPNKIPI
jgi:hypothetical protein